MAEVWELEDPAHARSLSWAARLHEIGQSISYSGHHKHGAYLLSNLDMPGFSRGEQRRLAALVRGHRRKIPLTEFARLPADQAADVLRLCVLLRLAFLLHRRRSDDPLPPYKFTVDAQLVKLSFGDDWLARHPLIRADLALEADYLRAADFKLKFK